MACMLSVRTYTFFNVGIRVLLYTCIWVKGTCTPCGITPKLIHVWSSIRSLIRCMVQCTWCSVMQVSCPQERVLKSALALKCLIRLGYLDKRL